MALNDTLTARKSRYGDFTIHAKITRDLKAVCYSSPSWESMTDVQKEGLDLILHKLARALCGDPNYSDTWHDIAGYATLIEQRCEEGK